MRILLLIFNVLCILSLIYYCFGVIVLIGKKIYQEKINQKYRKSVIFSAIILLICFIGVAVFSIIEKKISEFVSGTSSVMYSLLYLNVIIFIMFLKKFLYSEDKELESFKKCEILLKLSAKFCLFFLVLSIIGMSVSYFIYDINAISFMFGKDSFSVVYVIFVFYFVATYQKSVNPKLDYLKKVANYNIITALIFIVLSVGISLLKQSIALELVISGISLIITVLNRVFLKEHKTQTIEDSRREYSDAELEIIKKYEDEFGKNYWEKELSSNKNEENGKNGI